MHNRRTIRAAPAAFQGNIYQKHLCTRIVIDTVSTKKVFAISKQNSKSEPEAQGYCLMKKTGGRKSGDTVPLNHKLGTK
jgi:hypothetical protein